MADAAIRQREDSSKTERKCAWCGADISHRNSRARYCDIACKGRKHTFEQSLAAGYFPKEMFGPRPPVECPECGKVVEQSSGGKTYCEKDGPCSRKSARRRAISRGYFEQDYVKDRMRRAARMFYHEGRGSEYMAEWRHENRDHVNATARDYRRRRAAESALSMLILPIEEPRT